MTLDAKLAGVMIELSKRLRELVDAALGPDPRVTPSSDTFPPDDPKPSPEPDVPPTFCVDCEHRRDRTPKCSTGAGPLTIYQQCAHPDEVRIKQRAWTSFVLGKVPDAETCEPLCYNVNGHGRCPRFSRKKA